MQLLNTLYEVEQTTATTNLLNFIRESISNVYDLPSTQQTIRYLHAAAGFPTKATWLKHIQNYQTWPMVNVKNVSKYFPESEETQQGHMKNQRQGVRSTKVKVKDANLEELPTTKMPKKNDILISTYDTQEQCILTKQVNFHLSPAEAINTSWFCTMSIAIPFGLNQ